MWEPGEPIYDAHVELNRAEKNIDKITHGLIVLAYTQTCAVLAEDDPDSPGTLIWRLHARKNFPDVFPVLIGRTILAIRSSINMISTVLTKSSGRFASAPDFEGFVSAINGLESRLGTKKSQFDTLNMDDGGNFRYLKRLFNVDVGDDERVEVSYHARACRMHCGGRGTAVPGEWVIPDAIVKPFVDREIVICTPTTIRGLHCKANDSIDTSVDVTFDDGGPFQGKNVKTTLERLAKDASGVVDALRPFV